MPGQDVGFDRPDSILGLVELSEQQTHRSAGLVGERSLFRAGGTFAQLCQAPDAFGGDDPELAQQATDRVGELGALPDQQSPDPMQS
jgi:hypothetical protein